MREPKTTALVFASGKMVVTGAKSVTDVKFAAKKFTKLMQKLGFPAKFKEFKVQNVVGSCDVKFLLSIMLSWCKAISDKMKLDQCNADSGVVA